MSACETGLGQDDWASLGSPGSNADEDEDAELPDGREVASIAQAFIEAGANTVVASLWQVNDASTNQLMQSFYDHLAQNSDENSVTISQALRNAQLSMLQGGIDRAGMNRPFRL